MQTKKFQDFFDRVVIISLARRKERRRRLEKLLRETRWPFKQPEWFDAIDGGSGTVPVPEGFISGGGAYGCKTSWCRVLEDTMMAGHQSILVLEDDAIWKDDFVEQTIEFLTEVPADWQCLFLGGQNMEQPTRVSERVMRSRNTQRTHAIGLQGGGIRKAYKCFAASDRHIDHKFGPESGSWGRAYQPTNFLIGQAGVQSDISGRKDTTRFWSPPKPGWPVVWLRCTREVAEDMREYGCHYGNDRDSEGNDRGLNRKFPQPGVYTGGIRDFCNTIAWEAASFADTPGIVTIWHPNATGQCEERVLHELRDRKVHVITATTKQDAIVKLRAAIGADTVKIREDCRRNPVLLLSCPGEIVEKLRDESYIHTGYWRDETTGIDRGLISLVDAGATNLKAWYLSLEREVEGDGRLVGIYHPHVTKKLAETTGRRIVEIVSTDIDEARATVEGLL